MIAVMQQSHFTAPPVGATPAPVWELSGWWRRVGAVIIDGVVVGFPAGILIGLLFPGSDFASEGASASFHLNTVGTLIYIVVFAVYYMAVMTAWNGQTIGKKATGIRVVREDGGAITPGFAFVRQTLVIQLLFGMVAAILLFIPTILNYLWPLWDDKHQALHDKIVKSRVVRADPVTDPGGLQQMQQQYTQPPVQPQQPVAPPPPPPAGGPTPGTYAPPPGFENPVPDDE
jgi:uncharacterized RDD family membrane protein YckC